MNNIQFEITYDHFINASSTELLEEFLHKLARAFYRKGQADAMKEAGYNELSDADGIFWRNEYEGD